ncbi:RraA family protein [Egicoccus halophilus]|uniref:Putative 4-hydroxy-4-methyl-2-oxoglutarate aldolase n=1 Tax=Egicoccus halophilus TaxID=1670830 RepID=A0A8J3ABJ9_9ACTN|nr:4-hydroxy-4-methyl-2-oxoglutarate aldolase [Egicoccus halophilus]GGI07548.1 S-adenosylmethionine--2-demethylmenaquinone methyltransferase [Egicoccus halophilus]
MSEQNAQANGGRWLGTDLRWLGDQPPPTAADLHEAQGRTGDLPARIKPINPAMQVWGPAYTVAVPPGDNLWLHRAISAAPEGSVLVAGQTQPAEAGYWGEITTEAAMARGLRGLVFDGGVRDAAVLVELPFPIFAGQLCIRGTVKDPDSAGFVRLPITLGTARIRTGDLIVGDVDGVVVVPARNADRVVDAAVQRIEKERTMVEQIRQGASTLDLLGLR